MTQQPSPPTRWTPLSHTMASVVQMVDTTAQSLERTFPEQMPGRWLGQQLLLASDYGGDH